MSCAFLVRTTFPPAHRADACKILNGKLQSNSFPLLGYPGSTCGNRVLVGCCPNEGGWLIFAQTICCVKNHRGRFCQELTPGDLEILGKNPKDSASTIVDLGEVVKFTVHNNGCFGNTYVGRGVGVYNPLGGKLTGPALEGGNIKHYDQANSMRLTARARVHRSVMPGRSGSEIVN